MKTSMDALNLAAAFLGKYTKRAKPEEKTEEPKPKRVYRRTSTRWKYEYVEGENILASATLRIESDNSYSVWDLHVPLTQRRKGYATKLMRNMEKFVSEEKGKLIWLRVRWTNWSAVQFYHKLGYAPIKRVRNEEDGKIVLGKKIYS